MYEFTLPASPDTQTVTLSIEFYDARMYTPGCTGSGASSGTLTLLQNGNVIATSKNMDNFSLSNTNSQKYIYANLQGGQTYQLWAQASWGVYAANDFTVRAYASKSTPITFTLKGSGNAFRLQQDFNSAVANVANFATNTGYVK